MKRIAFFLALATAGFSCNSSSETKEDVNYNTGAAESSASTEATEEVATTETSEAVIEIESNDQMKYNLSEIRVKAGQKVKLTLKHVGKLPKASMGHNFVLLKDGTDIAKFAMAAGQARDSDYIADESSIIAHTKIIGGGESDTIEFDAPALGIYDFICSFPGHYAIMKGKFIVE
ncbi:azurin [Spirosomataceae bacterium TFI 002]|nr:azurin [Spirosomataceae bacterium TFI 002]